MDEIAIVLTEAEFDRLRVLLNDAWSTARGERGRDRIKKALDLICHNANKVSLSWLDQKLEEFA